MSDWQPIETAPKDGTNIIAFANGQITTVEWYQWSNGHWALCVSGSNSEDDTWWPTHWMPLPEPPK